MHEVILIVHDLCQSSNGCAVEKPIKRPCDIWIITIDRPWREMFGVREHRSQNGVCKAWESHRTLSALSKTFLNHETLPCLACLSNEKAATRGAGGVNSLQTGRRLKKSTQFVCFICTAFFEGVLGFRFGSLKSEKIIIGSLESEKIGSLESEKSDPYRVHTEYLTFSLKRNLLVYNFSSLGFSAVCGFEHWCVNDAKSALRVFWPTSAQVW